VEKKFQPVEITKSDDPNFDARFIMSASSPDRVKDTIDPRAYQPNLNKKLIALWQHKSDQPFGYWSNLRVKSGQLIGDLKVSATNLGQMIRQLIADGVPLGASIGFTGKGEQNDEGGIHFKEIELMECSVVSVPCHPAAMQVAKQLKQFGIELQSSESEPPAVSGDPEAALKRARNAVIAAKRLLKGTER